MVWPFRTAQERLDDQAALWLVRMEVAQRERFRADFERWLLRLLLAGGWLAGIDEA